MTIAATTPNAAEGGSTNGTHRDPHRLRQRTWPCTTRIGGTATNMTDYSTSSHPASIDNPVGQYRPRSPSRRRTTRSWKAPRRSSWSSPAAPTIDRRRPPTPRSPSPTTRATFADEPFGHQQRVEPGQPDLDELRYRRPLGQTGLGFVSIGPRIRPSSIILSRTSAAGPTALSDTTGLSGGTTYYYRVRATNGISSSGNAIPQRHDAGGLTATIVGTTRDATKGGQWRLHRDDEIPAPLSPSASATGFGLCPT